MNMSGEAGELIFVAVAVCCVKFGSLLGLATPGGVVNFIPFFKRCDRDKEYKIPDHPMRKPMTSAVKDAQNFLGVLCGVSQDY